MVDFPCTRCGACCRRVHLTDQLPAREDGSCVYLTTEVVDGTPRWGCEIYETRPDICRIGFARPGEMSEETYLKLTAQICDELQKQDGMDELYRVDISVLR